VAAKRFGLNLQTLGIRKRITDVDAVMTPSRQKWIYEVHPELCFWKMNRERAMKHNKKSKRGRDERLRVLARFDRHVKERTRAEKPPGVAMDDLLDAYAAAWTAMRIANGAAKRLPEDPPRDRHGLRMEIWY
jgi:predicted RNase H-like nuclease